MDALISIGYLSYCVLARGVM